MKRNIYHVLNDFGTHMKRKPLYTTIGFVDDVHIYFNIVYDKTSYIPESHIPGDWNEHSGGFGAKAVAKVWVTCDEKTKHPRFVLFNDNIYTNPYLTPNKNIAQEFFKARLDYFGSKTNIHLGSEEIELDRKTLYHAMKLAMKEINRYRELISHTTNLKELYSFTSNLKDLIDTYGILEKAYEMSKENNDLSY